MLKTLILSLALLIACHFPCVAQGGGASSEQRAYEKAVDYIKDLYGQRKKRYSESVFVDSLKTLTLSPSQEGDKYLSKLAFFVLDASAGEDYSCAASRRVATNRLSYLKSLRQSRDNFDDENPCSSFQSSKPSNIPGPSCLDKQEFTNLVASYESIEGKAEDNSEVDCSYLFE
jgi:hypothetical protein